MRGVRRASPDGILGVGFGSLARAPPVSDPMPSGRRVVPGWFTITRSGRFVSFGRPAPPNPSFPDALQAFAAIRHQGLPGADAGQLVSRLRRGCPRFDVGRRTGRGRDVDPDPSGRRGSGPRRRIYRPSPLRGPWSRNIRSGKGDGSITWGDSVGKRSGWIFGKSLELLGAGVGIVPVLVGGAGGEVIPDVRHAGLDPASSGERPRAGRLFLACARGVSHRADARCLDPGSRPG